MEEHTPLRGSGDDRMEPDMGPILSRCLPLAE